MSHHHAIDSAIERFAPPEQNDTADCIRNAVAFMNQHATVDPTVAPTDEDESDQQVGELDFGRVPHPPFQRRMFQKTANVGWDKRGPRQGQIVGTCVHMRVGRLIGSENVSANRSDA